MVKNFLHFFFNAPSLLQALLPGRTFTKHLWRQAQRAEFSWWKGIAETGYSSFTPEEFIAVGQRNWLLSQLAFLEHPLEYWTDKVVIEFGPGPAGFVEYLPAKQRIAIEPLIAQYRSVFPHLQHSTVEYYDCPAEEANGIECGCADLAVCFNMLDHTYCPDQVMKEIARSTKAGGELFFQLNVYRTTDELSRRAPEHAALHPSPFLLEEAIQTIQRYGFDILRQSCTEGTNPCGEYYFMCAARKAECDY